MSYDTKNTNDSGAKAMAALDAFLAKIEQAHQTPADRLKSIIKSMAAGQDVDPSEIQAAISGQPAQSPGEAVTKTIVSAVADLKKSLEAQNVKPTHDAYPALAALANAQVAAVENLADAVKKSNDGRVADSSLFAQVLAGTAKVVKSLAERIETLEKATAATTEVVSKSLAMPARGPKGQPSAPAYVAQGAGEPPVPVAGAQAFPAPAITSDASPAQQRAFIMKSLKQAESKAQSDKDPSRLARVQDAIIELQAGGPNPSISDTALLHEILAPSVSRAN